MTEIQKKLFEAQDIKYGDFQASLTPSVERKKFIGVRTPSLRKMAKELYGSDAAQKFLEELPHEYFEENQLHGFLISLEKDFKTALKKTEEFLPYVDNWATCDQTSPKIFKKHTDELLPHIKKWLKSGKTYTIRFGIKCLMEFFLDECFCPEYPDMVAAVKSDEYYVNMMIAWYFATALAKQWDSAVVFIEQKKMERWCHNKAIQKARESFRIPEVKKEYLKSFKY